MYSAYFDMHKLSHNSFRNIPSKSDKFKTLKVQIVLCIIRYDSYLDNHHRDTILHGYPLLQQLRVNRNLLLGILGFWLNHQFRTLQSTLQMHSTHPIDGFLLKLFDDLAPDQFLC